jgi:MFS transporter, CP family, cyanate transporter
VARATGVWSNGLLVGELAGAALTLPLVLPLAGGSWELALAIWSVPVFITAALFAIGTPHNVAEAQSWRGTGLPNFRRAQTWQLGLLQSSASLMYFGSNTFIPDYLHVLGQPDLVGISLTALNLAQIPPSFVIGLFPWPVLAHRANSYLTGVLTLFALGLMLTQQPALIVAGAAILGFAGAYVLVVCFALPALIAAPADVSRLSAGTFTISYTVAFASNLAAGALWDATQIAASAFIPVLAGATLVTILGPRLVAASMAGYAPQVDREESAGARK